MNTRILIGALLLSVAGFANATNLCKGGSEAKAETVTAVGKFIKEDFKMNCSKNVYLDYAEDDFNLGVCAVSFKGKNVFGGSSNGGSASVKGKCAAADGCVAGDVKVDKDAGCAGAAT